MPSPDVRTLVVLRHAKAAWPDGVEDLDRPLSDRGRRDAAAVGAWLRERDLRPDVVVRSPARRTAETWAEASRAFEDPPPEEVDERVWGAGPERLLAVAAELPPTAGTALLVGHEPGASRLASALVADDDPLRPVVLAGLPTSGIVVLRTPPWPVLQGGTAVLAEVAAPRG